ncbi:Allantoin permease [Penicillium verhagenii]|nr:Allantoin permease [Penicillium verhagenii]
MSLRTFLKRIEINAEGGLVPDRWINNDIKPIEAGRRTWGHWTFHNFWVLVNSNISTYMTGSSLIALGLTWWQAIVAIIVGQLLATVFVILNSIPGAFYYHGFQAWIGGECVYVCLQAIWPDIESRIPNSLSASTGTTTATFVAYIIFMIISLPFIWIHPHKLNTFFYASAATILVFEIVLLIWSLATMGHSGLGSTMSSASTSTSGWNIAFGIISTIGSIAAGILNQNDYARFARKPSDAIWGQLISFPFYGITCSIIGILVTAATQNRFGEAYWNLPTLLGAIIEDGGSRSRAAGFFGGAALVVSQIGVNVPGNSLAGGFDLAATFPKYINIRRGAYITAIVSIACNPWKLVNTATTFLTVLSSYSVFLGPMTGLMISSYFFVNKGKIKVEDLFIGNSSSIYWYTYGVDWRAVLGWACGTAPSLPGFIAYVNPNIEVPVGFMHLYYICFLSGFFISAGVYSALHHVFPVPAVVNFVERAPSARTLMEEYREQWDRDDDSETVLTSAPKLDVI